MKYDLDHWNLATVSASFVELQVKLILRNLIEVDSEQPQKFGRLKLDMTEWKQLDGPFCSLEQIWRTSWDAENAV